jgi:hypothetical protein
VPDRPLQPRNPAEGPKQKYIVHRLLCPYFRLSVYERYSVPVSATLLDRVFADAHAVVRELTKSYRRKGSDPDVLINPLQSTLSI